MGSFLLYWSVDYGMFFAEFDFCWMPGPCYSHLCPHLSGGARWGSLSARPRHHVQAGGPGRAVPFPIRASRDVGHSTLPAAGHHPRLTWLHALCFIVAAHGARGIVHIVLWLARITLTAHCTGDRFYCRSAPATPRCYSTSVCQVAKRFHKCLCPRHPNAYFASIFPHSLC